MNLIQRSQLSVSESVQEYLKMLWISEEEGNSIAKVGWLAKHLGVKSPSVVEMYKKLEERGFVMYYPYRGIKFMDEGRAVAKHVMRNHRLVEFLMKQTLNIDVDEGIVCGVEHHMTEEFTDALCSLLGHPRRCPHGNLIPMGSCCNDSGGLIKDTKL